MILQIQSFNYKHWLEMWRYKRKLWFSGYKVFEWNMWIKERSNSVAIKCLKYVN